MRHALLLVLCLWVQVPACLLAADAQRWEWSGGTNAVGTVRLAPGAGLRLYDGERWHEVDWSRVAELHRRIAGESHLYRWRFRTPGQAAIEQGVQRGSRQDFLTTLILRDGGVLQGSLQTTAVLLRADGAAEDTRWERLVLPSRRVLAPDEDDPFLRRLVLAPVAAGAGPALPMPPDLQERPALIVTRPGLTRLHALSLDGVWHLPPHGATGLFVAVPAADGLHLAWPSTDEPLPALLAAAEAFFDVRQLAAAWHDPSDASWYLVVSARHSGRSTGAPPWQWQLWRCRLDLASGRATVIDRVHLVRGLADQEAMPGLRLRSDWWALLTEDDG